VAHQRKMSVIWQPTYARVRATLELGGADFLCVCLSYFGGWRSPVSEVMSKVGHTGDGEPTHSHEERYGSRTWGDSTHKQACLQAITVGDGECNVRLDGERGEANAGGRAGCTRA
jgi:hypothetical protein